MACTLLGYGLLFIFRYDLLDFFFGFPCNFCNLFNRQAFFYPTFPSQKRNCLIISTLYNFIKISRFNKYLQVIKNQTNTHLVFTTAKCRHYISQVLFSPQIFRQKILITRTVRRSIYLGQIVQFRWELLCKKRQQYRRSYKQWYRYRRLTKYPI